MIVMYIVIKKNTKENHASEIASTILHSFNDFVFALPVLNDMTESHQQKSELQVNLGEFSINQEVCMKRFFPNTPLVN